MLTVQGMQKNLKTEKKVKECKEFTECKASKNANIMKKQRL